MSASTPCGLRSRRTDHLRAAVAASRDPQYSGPPLALGRERAPRTCGLSRRSRYRARSSLSLHELPIGLHAVSPPMTPSTSPLPRRRELNSSPTTSSFSTLPVNSHEPSPIPRVANVSIMSGTRHRAGYVLLVHAPLARLAPRPPHRRRSPAATPTGGHFSVRLRGGLIRRFAQNKRRSHQGAPLLTTGSWLIFIPANIPRTSNRIQLLDLRS